MTNQPPETHRCRRPDRLHRHPRPIQATQRWPIERTNSWMNGYGKLRRMTGRNPAIVVYCLYLASDGLWLSLQHRARSPRW